MSIELAPADNQEIVSPTAPQTARRPRRAAGMGAVYRKGDSWEGRIELPVDPADPDGPKKSYYRRARTKRDVVAKLNELRDARPLAKPRDSLKVLDFSAVWFMAQDDEVRAGKIRARTAADYKKVIERYVLPRIGHRELADITSATYANLLRALAARGGRDCRPLGPHSIRLIRLSLRWMLAEAQRHGYTRPNLMAEIDADTALGKRPRNAGAGAAKKAARLEKTPTTEQVRTLLELVQDPSEITKPAAVLTLVAAFSGARRGELAAARFRDFTVQADGSAVWLVSTSATVADGEVVVNPVKNGEPRSVEIDPVVVRAVDALRRSPDRQFTEFIGGGFEPMHPDALQSYYRSRAKSVGMPTGMHGLRRYVATRAVALNGGDAVAAAEALGHDPEVLLRHYLVNADPERVRSTTRAIAAELLLPAATGAS